MAASVSCTIMAYNEEATLAQATKDVIAGLSGLPERAFEVIIVDDGSTDRTPQIAAELAARHPQVRVVTHPQNRGPGSAIITGFAESKMELVCFHPADQQVPFAQVAELVPLLDRYDMVVGQRLGRPGYTALRLLSSHVYIGLVHLLFGLRQFNDFNFIYLYRKDLLDRIALETSGVFMTTEVLVKAVDLGARLTAASVPCLPRTAGVASCGRPAVIGQTIAQMLGFWARWRWRRLRG